MRLSVTTPLAIIAEVQDVVHLRAEDETGAFGILRGHADFLTVLALSVVSWRGGEGVEHHIAVRGGVLEVRDGEAISIATREAVADDDLQRLETEVLTSFHRRAEEELTARADAQRLYLAAIRQVFRFLKSERAPAMLTGPGALSQDGLSNDSA
jgi:F-type H+-transporting ATPase subunit epsilon